MEIIWFQSIILIVLLKSFLRGDDSESQGKETFCKWFNDIGELRSLNPRSSVLALSATCTIKIRKRVMKVLHLADNFKEMVFSPNKTNIRISVAKV